MANIYKTRRDQLLNRIDEGIIIIPSANYAKRSNDTDYPFRQNSNFYYFTGFLENNSTLILKKMGSKQSSILFLQDKNPELELWTGKRLGPDLAINELSVDQSYPTSSFNEIIAELIEGHQKVYINAYENGQVTSKVYQTCHKLWSSRKKTTYIPNQIVHLDFLTEEMRLIKDTHELDKMEHAANLTSRAHMAAMAKVQAGKNERDIDGLLDYCFKLEGGSGPAYESIVASGNNANVLHYVSNNMDLIDGELLLIDAGAEYGLYASDVTRTIPINGKYTKAQKDIYQVVLNSQLSAIKMAKPNTTLKEIHEHTSKKLIEGMLSLNILSGDVEDIFTKGLHRKYYPHGTGHWLGLDVHDQCPYLDSSCEDIILKENMIFTIEPGLYLREDDHSIPSEYRGIGIRIEDDVAITKDSNRVLTKDIPKTIEEVEEACKEDYRNFL